MDIKLPSNLVNKFHRASIWKQIFIYNYYDNKEHFLPKDNVYQAIDDDIDKELEKLYSLCEDTNYFKVEVDGNEYLEREYENELNAVMARGESRYYTYAKNNKVAILERMAERYSEFLKEEYKHIVDVIRNSDYDNAFKYLMLSETLTKIYKKENGKIIVSKREKNKSINEHMILNYDVLDYIYRSIDKCDSFPKLYFSAIEYSKEKSLSRNEVSLEGVNTFNKGRWIKFEGKKEVDPTFSERVNKLKALVADTNWCTKNLASSHLAQGDFYVFVDHENKPHLAVKMRGNSIDEVRGILKGQRIEEEYEDVIYDFLTKNKDIKNGDAWLEQQKWNEQLKYYVNLIENKIVLNEEELKSLQDIMFGYNEYRSHGGENLHLEKLFVLVAKEDYIIEYFKKSNPQLNAVQYNTRISHYLKSVELSKEIDAAATYEEMEKTLIKLHLEPAGITEGNKFSKTLFSGKLKEPRVIDILASRLEDSKNIEFLTLDEVEVEGNRFKVKDNICNLVNGAYILKKLDSVDSYEELEKILKHLYQVSSYYVDPKIEQLHLSDEIKKKLKSDRIMEIIAKEFNCRKEDIVFLNHDVNPKVTSYDNKYIFGYLRISGASAKVEVGAKAVFGTIVYDTYYSSKFSSAYLSFPNLEYCVSLHVNGNDKVRADKLKYTPRLCLRAVSKIYLPSLVEVGDLSIDEGAKYVDLGNLEKAERVHVGNVKYFNLENLKEVTRTVDLDTITECAFPKLKKIGGYAGVSSVDRCLMPTVEKIYDVNICRGTLLDVSSLKAVYKNFNAKRMNVISCDSLESVGGNIDISGAEGVSLSSLKELGGKLILVHTKCDKLPEIEEIKSRLVATKKGRN